MGLTERGLTLLRRGTGLPSVGAEIRSQSAVLNEVFGEQTERNACARRRGLAPKEGKRALVIDAAPVRDRNSLWATGPLSLRCAVTEGR
jgi:hypothetical protein